ncbi:MAG: hypothetical protein ACJAR9_000898 [Celeribacter sp.]|jgi:hypothetical protein
MARVGVVGGGVEKSRRLKIIATFKNLCLIGEWRLTLCA